jgi:hypothetical protein
MKMLVVVVTLFAGGCSVGQCIEGTAEHQAISLPDAKRVGMVTLTAPAGTPFALCVW